MLEGLEAVHDAHWFKEAAKGFGFDMRDGVRGHPLNQGEELRTTHPVIRVSESKATHSSVDWAHSR